MTDKLTLHYSELPKLKSYDTNDELSLWLALFNAKTEQDLDNLVKLEVDFVNEAVQDFSRITTNPEYRELELKRELRRRDEDNALSFARKQGIAQGLEQGLSQGLEQGKVETALAMIKDGFDLITIAKYVQMPISQLEEIKTKNLT